MPDRLILLTKMATVGRVEPGRAIRRHPWSFDLLDTGGQAEHELWVAHEAERLDREPGAAPAVRATLEALADELLTITRALAAEYGTPHLDNKSDPVDELVYIILSRRTREGAYQAAYNELKRRYPRWEQLAGSPAEEIEAAIASSGLGRRKAQSLKSALGALIERFGCCTLEPTRSWDDNAVLEFLCSLPEVGPKSAACVMVCALDRPAFPVDAHVGRVLARLGTFRTVAIELKDVDHKAKQRLLADAVPPSLRYILHVNLLVHGRAICLPGRPRCHCCILAADCDYA